MVKERMEVKELRVSSYQKRTFVMWKRKFMYVLVLNSLKCIFPLIFDMIQIWFWKINLRVYSQAKTWMHIWHIFTLKNKQRYSRLIGTSSVIKTEWSNIMYTRHHILLLITNRSLLLTTNKGRISPFKKWVKNIQIAGYVARLR